MGRIEESRTLPSEERKKIAEGYYGLSEVFRVVFVSRNE